jgi:hypothetical protein
MAATAKAKITRSKHRYRGVLFIRQTPIRVSGALMSGAPGEDFVEQSLE